MRKRGRGEQHTDEAAAKSKTQLRQAHLCWSSHDCANSSPSGAGPYGIFVKMSVILEPNFAEAAAAAAAAGPAPGNGGTPPLDGAAPPVTDADAHRTSSDAVRTRAIADTAPPSISSSRQLKKHGANTRMGLTNDGAPPTTAPSSGGCPRCPRPAPDRRLLWYLVFAREA